MKSENMSKIMDIVNDEFKSQSGSMENQDPVDFALTCSIAVLAEVSALNQLPNLTREEFGYILQILNVMAKQIDGGISTKYANLLGAGTATTPPAKGPKGFLN